MNLNFFPDPLALWKSNLRVRICFCVNDLSFVVYFAVTLQLQSFGNSLVRIYSPKMGRFIAMDSNGRLFSTVSVKTIPLCSVLFLVKNPQNGM